MTASFWYTAWVNAGMPDLNDVDTELVSKEEVKDSIVDSKIQMFLIYF